MNPLHKKIRLKENQIIATVNAPKDFQDALLPLPLGVKITKGIGTRYDFIYWFLKTEAEMVSQLNMITGAMKEDTLVWILFPKSTSGIQTDLTRDKGWDAMMKRDDLSWVSLISYDDTWSAFAMRKKTDLDRKREAKPVEREIFKWADPKTKTLKLPEDMAKKLSTNKKAKEFFDAQNFSNRREYVEWIITAKREETRKQRVDGMVERLLKGFRNPSGRN